MAEPSTHINYTFEDIQRYLLGKMPAAEMHDLEKAALQDPFLADAIEGFNEADLATAQQHLNEINTSLMKEKKASKVVAFNKRTQWLNIAAIVIVLAGIGVVAAISLNNAADKKTEVAQTRITPQQNEIQKDSSVMEAIIPAQTTIDSSSLIAENKAPKKENETSQKRIQPAEKVKDQKGIEPSNDVAGLNEGNAEKLAASTQANTMLSRSFSINDTLLQPENKTVKPALAPTIFSGQVVDENNKAIPGVLVQSPGKKDAVVTDLNGDFNLLAKDTTLRVTASTVGYLEQVTNLTSGYNSPIVLRARPTNLNEVVRVGYDAAKKQAVNIDSFIQAKSLAKDSTMPVGGWQNFNHYVMTQLDKDTVSTPEVYGNDLVELEFLVDNTGSPYNIKITKPLDKTRNAKAIEILKNGPRWISTSHRKKNKVTISF